jgi:hypothetical protein
MSGEKIGKEEAIAGLPMQLGLMHLIKQDPSVSVGQ